MEKWNNIDYQTIHSAKISNGMMEVIFENSDVAELSLQSLLPFAPDIIKNIKSEDLHLSAYEIQIDTITGSVVIPWDKIRVHTDKEFSRHLSEKAEEQAKLIGIKIKRLRERKGLKSNDLAERSGITAQTISRIEKGHQDIGFTTLRKLLASMGYSLNDLANEETELEYETSENKTFPFLLKRLSKIGIDPSFVIKRIIPNSIQAELNTFQNEQPDLLLDEAASYVSDIYGWAVKEIWGNSELTLDESSVNATLFKKGSRSNNIKIKAYVPYAYFLAKVVLKTHRKAPIHPFPQDIEEFKKTLIKNYGGVDLSSVINYAWNMGICVIPLKDSGFFHGAAWNIDGKFVIVLKQKVDSHSKWLFDILHEIYHVLVHLANSDEAIIESKEISPVSKDEDKKELEANSFASQVIFNIDPEILAQEAVTLAKGKTEFLKNAVQEIAIKHDVPVDSLANYIAYRLSIQGNQWWNTADSLQQKEPNPFDITRKILLENIDIKALGSVDHNLLSTALNM